MAKNPDQRTLTINLDRDIYDEVSAAAKAEDRSVTAVMRRLIAGYLDDTAKRDKRLIRIASQYDKMSEHERAWLAECADIAVRAK